MVCNDTPILKQNKIKLQSCFVALLNQVKGHGECPVSHFMRHFGFDRSKSVKLERARLLRPFKVK